MRINTNVSALAAWRQLSGNDSRLSSSLQRLASGHRINRAADDAAGLAVSEKMKTQVQGMEQAVRNARDAMSMLQTMDGALQTIMQDMHRIRELAVQAGNDTLTQGDRSYLYNEIDRLSSNIETTVAASLEFNCQKLLVGEEYTFHVGPGRHDVLTIQSPDLPEIFELSTFARATIGNGSIVIQAPESGPDGNLHMVEVVHGQGENQDLVVEPLPIVVEGEETGGTMLRITLGTDGDGQLDPVKNTVEQVVMKINRDTDFEAEARSYRGDDPLHAEEGPKSLYGGWTMQDTAELLERVDQTLSQLAGERATIGATQNRLEHRLRYLQMSAENLAAAESRIRDADMAQESVSFTKEQILVQAGTAMLVQANMRPQSVLQLIA